MALSNDTNKNTASDPTFILDIAKAIAIILDDPKGFQKAVKDSVSISESEQAKADEARELISSYAGKIAELKQAQAENDSFRGELEQNNKDLKEAQVNLNKRETELNKRDILLNQAESKQASLEADLANREKKLQSALVQFDKDSTALDEREKEIEEKEEILRTKTEEARRIFG